MEEKKTESHEIDVLALAGKVLKNWKRLLAFFFVSAAIGIIVALNTPKTYNSEVLLAPELSSGGLGLSDNLADMASTFGIELGGKSSMDAIYPELYPDIFASTDFIMKLFDVPVRLKDNDTIRTYYTHITKEQKIPFWEYPKGFITELLKKDDPGALGSSDEDRFKISKRDDEVCGFIRKAILCTIDKKTSVITITVSDQDPLVAAIVADTLQSRLQAYITRYRTKKARTDFEYYNSLANEAKEKYIKAQREYASFSDANMEVGLESYRTKIDQLENEMQLKYNIYTQMTAQMQQAQAKIQERTPAFTILQRPIMPYKASSTPRALVVLLFVFIGIAIDTIWTLYGNNHKKKDGVSEMDDAPELTATIDNNESSQTEEEA